MCYDISYKDDRHVILGIRQSVFACSEEVEDRIDETILKEKPLKEILVNYDAEVLLGEEVKLYSIYQDTDEGLIVYIQGIVEEKTKFSVKLIF